MIRIALVIFALCITSAALAEQLPPYTYTQTVCTSDGISPLTCQSGLIFAKTQRPPQPRARRVP